jgi:hypothetical protein
MINPAISFYLPISCFIDSKREARAIPEIIVQVSEGYYYWEYMYAI